MQRVFARQTDRTQAGVVPFLLVLLLLLLPVRPAAGAGGPGEPEVGEEAYVEVPRECAVVRHLTIHRHNIFRSEEQHAGSFYGRWSNRLHTVTRESVILRGLRFAPGDMVCRADLEAAVRRLRALGVLHSNIDIAVESVAGDSIDVTVETRDIWTTRPTVQFRKDGRVVTWSLGLSEANVLGLGKGVGLEVGHGEIKPYYGGWYRDPQFTPLELLLYGAIFDGDDLWSRSLLVEKPFEQASTPWALRVWASGYRGVIVDHRGGLDGPEWHSDQWLVTASGGVRMWGRPHTAVRLGPAAYLLSEGYRPPPEDPGASGRYGGPLAARDVRMIGGELDFSCERFSQRASINAFHLREDFDLGTRVQLRAGYSARRWGAARDGYVVLGEGYQGLSLGRRQFMLGTFLGEGQWIDGRVEDLRLVAAAYFYRNLDRRQTLAAAIRHGSSVRTPPQAVYTLGAITGLRGFESYSVWGERMLLANLEDRVLLVQDLLGLVSVGVTLFTDCGLAWSAGRSEEARPRADVGMGLRLLGSRSSGGLVTRIDVAFPALGAEEGAGAVLSIGAGQVF
jgi:hypothetical protein